MSDHHESRDRFVDALLEHRFRETPLSMERRVARVVRAASARSRPTWQLWALPIAALLTISLLVLPQESAADALLKTAIRAAAKPCDRRYRVEFTPVPHPGDAPGAATVAILDVRDDAHMRCEFQRPNGDLSVRGRSGDAAWEIHPNGDAVILDREPHWPRWIETPDGSLLVDSMAGVLDGLRSGYELTTGSGDPACAAGQAVHAARRGYDAQTEPESIDICVDPLSGEVTRLEMRFVKPSSPGDDSTPPPPPPHRRSPDHRPPSSIVFTRVPCDGFSAGWFDAPADARHAPPRPR